MGLVLCGIIFFAGILAQVITVVDPSKLAMRNKFLPPGEEGFLFGTDNFGRSLWSRVVWGAQLSLYHRLLGRGAERHLRHADRRGGGVFPAHGQRG